MKRCLVDVNVLLALLYRHHEHHLAALAWYDSLGNGEVGLCRIVHLGLLRLLANKTLLGDDVFSVAGAWQRIHELREDTRISFVPEPAGLEDALASFLRTPNAGLKVIADAYLAAFAIAGSMRMTTLDRGFLQFKGLDLELLPG